MAINTLLFGVMTANGRCYEIAVSALSLYILAIESRPPTAFVACSTHTGDPGKEPSYLLTCSTAVSYLLLSITLENISMLSRRASLDINLAYIC